MSVVGEGGSTYTFNVQVKCEAYARLCTCVCVCRCYSVSMYGCVCWDAVAVTASAAAASERVATFSFVLRARGGCPLDDKFFRTHTLLMLFLLLPTVQERKTNTKLPVF